MGLYIRIKDGVPFEHPIFEENFREAFPDVDINNLPPEVAPFVRGTPPQLGVYEVLENPDATYEFVDGVWTDVWYVRDMTLEEKAAKQQTAKDDWATRWCAENFVAWIFNEEFCRFEPPIPRPVDGKQYYWQGATLSWVERPPRPDDEKQYKLDFINGVWVEVV